MGKLRSRDWERVVRILMVFSFSVMALVVPIVVVRKAKNSGTSLPTSAPSSVPSDVPSEVPTRSPTASPSGIPSANPSSLPSIGPSPAPTMVYFDTNPVPLNPPRGYFNYDTNDTEYGPSRWNRVDTSNHPIREFGRNGFGPWKGHLSDDPARNQCGGPDRRQSPKNLVGTIECDAHHEIRTWVSFGTEFAPSVILANLVLTSFLLLLVALLSAVLRDGTMTTLKPISFPTSCHLR